MAGTTPQDRSWLGRRRPQVLRLPPTLSPKLELGFGGPWKSAEPSHLWVPGSVRLGLYTSLVLHNAERDRSGGAGTVGSLRSNHVTPTGPLNMYSSVGFEGCQVNERHH